MIYKLCRRWKKPITHPTTYCSNCLPIIEDKRQQLLRERENRYNKKRDPKYKAFYNSNDWKLLKDKKMMDEEYKVKLYAKQLKLI